MTPDPWDWTPVRERIAALPAGQVHALDDAVADLRAHVHAAGLHPSPQVGEAMWLGARLAIGILAPLLAYAGDDQYAQAHIQAHLDQIEDTCAAARDLWPPRQEPTSHTALLAEVERLRRDHERDP